MKETKFDASLLSLFDAPAAKETKVATVKHNFALRLAYQDAKAWAKASPRAYGAIANVFAERDIDLSATLGIKVITTPRKDDAGKPILDPVTKKAVIDITYDVTEAVIPNTKDDDLTDPMWNDIMDECKQLKAAYQAFKASLAPAK